MSELNNVIKELLASQKVNLVIGYAEGVGNNVKPYFAADPEMAGKFIFDPRCTQNLATYIHKPEIKAFLKTGKLGIVTVPPAIRTLLQLAAENQVQDGQIMAILMTPDGKAVVMSTFAEFEAFVAQPVPPPPPAIAMKQRMEEIAAMSREDRWQYWTQELGNCIKCYACRSACPLCYCTQCTVESNQPQWIQVASHELGNMEWHILRAMHLAARCIGCGECTRACPMEIPVSLLSFMMNDYSINEFGQRPGTKATLDYALSSFKVDDKENFIR